MATTVNQYLTEEFGTAEGVLKKLGAFDAFIDEDALLFVDPHLIKKCTTPEFVNGYTDLIQHFTEILTLLLASDSEGDKFWNAARQRLKYKERSEFGLGYAGAHRAGSGVGDGLRDQILKSIKTLLTKGIKDPVLFELVGIFEPNFGCDRISDMTCDILYPQFLQYTARVIKTLGIEPTLSLDTELGKVGLIAHPNEDEKPIVLVPEELLKDLPVAEEFSSLAYLSDRNFEVRDKLNKDLGKEWRKRVTEYSKQNYKEYLLQTPEVVRLLVAEYKNSKSYPYDLERDYAGVVKWNEVAQNGMEEFPLHSCTKVETKEDLVKLVKDLISHYKSLIEDRGLWRNLYRDTECEDPHLEKYVQNIFTACASYYCEVNDLDLTPEANAGRGPVDFKLSRGAKFNAIVEVKKSNNSRLVHALEKQVPIYEKGNKSSVSYLVVVKVEDASGPLELLNRRCKELEELGKQLPTIIVIDGRPKASASTA